MENAQYFYTEAAPNKSDNPRFMAASYPTIVLWDGNTGEPFFLPQGGDPMRYIAKGFKTNPPKGWASDPSRPVRKPMQPMAAGDWEPTRTKSGNQLEYERKLAEMKQEAERKESLRVTTEQNAGRLAEALEALISTSKPAAKAKASA